MVETEGNLNPTRTRTMEQTRILPRSVRNSVTIRERGPGRNSQVTNRNSTFEFGAGTSNSFSLLSESVPIDVDTLDGNGAAEWTQNSTGHSDPSCQDLSNSHGPTSDTGYGNSNDVLALQGRNTIPGMEQQSRQVLDSVEDRGRGDGMGEATHSNAHDPVDCTMEGAPDC